MARSKPSSAPGERGKGVLRTFLPRSARAPKPSSRPGEDVVLANTEAGAEKVRSLTLLSADIQRRNVVGLVGLTLGWRRGALDPSGTSDSALTMLRLSVNVHLTARGRKVDYARSFCFALGHEVGVVRPSSLSDRTVDAVAGIEGLRGFDDDVPRLAVAPAPSGPEESGVRETTAAPRADESSTEAARVEPARSEPPRSEPARSEPPRAEPSRATAPPVEPAAPARDDRPTGPGWYPDPGRHAPLRFWDGHRWTARVSGDGRMWLSPLGSRDHGRS